jgi:hypothetical protein
MQQSANVNTRWAMIKRRVKASFLFFSTLASTGAFVLFPSLSTK